MSDSSADNLNPGGNANDSPFDAVPPALTERDHWVCWREEDRDGDPTKIPIDATAGRYASTTDQTTWTSFDQAIAYHDDPDTDTNGVGFVFAPEDTIAGVDLDNCRDPETGNSSDLAEDIIRRLDSYTEVSPSGTGYHVYVEGIVPDGRNRHDGVEMYDEGRFFTVTGKHIDVTPCTVKRRVDTLREIHTEYVARDESAGNLASSQVDVETGATATVDLSDDELIHQMKNADDGGKFERLWSGSTSGYDSHSEARMALLCKLAFWTAKDYPRMDRLYRDSGLYPHPDKPGKWERVGDDEIKKAISITSATYDPDADNTGDAPSGVPDDPIPPGDIDRTDADRGDGWDVALYPGEVKALAGLGEDDDLSDLNDRRKAASVWELLKHSDRYHICVRRDNGSLWAYDAGIWKPEGERALRHAARQALGSMNYGQNVLTELKAQARSDPHAEVEPEEFGLASGTIAVKNGLVDLAAAADGAGKDALRELKPDDYALTRLPVEYDPNANYDEWADYVDEWAEDGRADALQEYIGYCLHIGAMPLHRALLLVGSGANGKGTFLHVVRSLLGRENTSSIELQTLANEKDAVADFYGALANIDDDLSARKLGQGLGMFKKLVGGDRVRARRLYKDGFEFDATGKHLYAANEVPDVNVPDDDEAFWRRWLLVEFSNHYPPSQRDPDLRDRLAEPDVLSGVLNWAIDGWARLLDQDHFTGEEQYAQAKRERWQAWGDSVDKFISECVERDPDAENVSTGDVHRVYAAWCRENGERPASQQKLTAELKNEDLDYAKSVRPGGTGTPTRGYKALGFTDEAPDIDDTPERASGQQRLG